MKIVVFFSFARFSVCRFIDDATWFVGQGEVEAVEGLSCVGVDDGLLFAPKQFFGAEFGDGLGSADEAAEEGVCHVTKWIMRNSSICKVNQNSSKSALEDN